MRETSSAVSPGRRPLYTKGRSLTSRPCSCPLFSVCADHIFRPQKLRWWRTCYTRPPRWRCLGSRELILSSPVTRHETVTWGSIPTSGGVSQQNYEYWGLFNIWRWFMNVFETWRFSILVARLLEKEDHHFISFLHSFLSVHPSDPLFVYLPACMSVFLSLLLSVIVVWLSMSSTT